jgi:thiol-disulfide isomerase/thioredoxin
VEALAGGWEDRNTLLPGFELLDLSGKRWTDADLKGKITFINVWATWCGPCRGELPHLQKLQEKLRGDPGVQLLTLNIDGNPGLVAPFMARNGFTFPALPAEEYVARLLEQVGVPRNWIVDREGRIIREQVGFGGEGENWITDALAEIQKASGARR